MNHPQLSANDPQVAAAIEAEERRQNDHLEMIASENFTSLAVMQAQGSVLTNKYAEGLPSKRYYGGCEHVDVVETLAIERAKQLFGAEHANVQPHSGASANAAVYLAALSPGDPILGLNLSHGGHLTHGSPVALSGIWFKSHFYGVEADTGLIDYDKVLATARETRPKLLIAGASAYPRTLDFHAFRRIADEVGALLMVDMAHIAGLIAAGLHPSPIGIADFVTTTTHKTLRGPRGGMVLAKGDWGKAVDKAVFPGLQGGPLMHVIAAKAVALGEALQPAFKDYQKQVIANAKALGEELVANGLTLVSGGTDTHLLLIDLRPQNRTGKEIDAALGSVGITANKNTVPGDPNGPMVTSGIRLGTPAITTRGMKEADMREIARHIALIVQKPDSEAVLDGARRMVKELCRAHPLYPEALAHVR